MLKEDTVFKNLSDAEITEIRNCCTAKEYNDNDLVFSEGDEADAFYLIETGCVSIFITKGGKKEPVAELGPGDWFGEMAIFSDQHRTASAVATAKSGILSVAKDRFLEFTRQQPDVARKIQDMLEVRNEELALKESLSNVMGVSGTKFHVALKGDPSLRETVFTRERYESVVDSILPQLVKSIEELMLNRSAYQVFVGFNNGEVRVGSVFDPFGEEVHAANKIIEKGYLDRHFPKIAFDKKAGLIKDIYKFISRDPLYGELPRHWKHIFVKTHENWKPVTPDEISVVLRKLPEMREMSNVYLRNFGISLVQDEIRMQFNCDGTHIVSSKGYEQFVEENI